MNDSSKRSPFVGIVILLIIIGLIATYSSLFTGANNQSTNQAPVAQVDNQKEIISYQGEDGKNALELLERKYQTETTEGFVNSINGVKPSEKEFWALYVNGKMSSSGAKDTITKNTDTIEWKLDSF